MYNGGFQTSNRALNCRYLFGIQPMWPKFWVALVTRLPGKSILKGMDGRTDEKIATPKKCPPIFFSGSNLKQHTSHHELKHWLPGPNMSHHEPKIFLQELPRAKNWEIPWTTSQKLIIPDSSSFCIDYVSIIYVPADLSCKFFQKYYLDSHSIL